MSQSITLDGATFQLAEGESVLDALERNGVPMLSSCRSGVCQSCLMRALEGDIPAKAQQGLKDSLKAQKYFLSCVCIPTEPLTVAMPGESLDLASVVLESDDIGAAVRRVRFSVPEGFTWFAGQYITLIREDGIARSYSVASSPEDGHLELHVRRIPGGALSNWLHDELPVGATVKLRGAFGDCFYTPGEPDAPLLLAGTGTGLAPLFGIVRESIRQKHSGPVRVFHGALDENGLYLREEMRQLAADHGVDYKPCILKNGASDQAELTVGALDAIVTSQPIDTKTTKAYLCGDPGLVGKMRKQLFLRGLSNRRIFADAFVATVVKKD